MKLDTFPTEPRLSETQQAPGVRIMTGKLAIAYTMAQRIATDVMRRSFPDSLPIILPTIEPVSIYTDKMGEEVPGQMYTFKDKGDRDLCLRPEATATCQLLAQRTFKTYPNLMVYYWQRCYRYERPQAGRYREFTQFGVEWFQPKLPEGDPSGQLTITDHLVDLGVRIIREITTTYGDLGPVGAAPVWRVSQGVKRGLGIYNEAGFEFICEELGAQKQILGGGPYEGGIGFGIGIDRVLLIPGVVDNLVNRWKEAPSL